MSGVGLGLYLWLQATTVSVDTRVLLTTPGGGPAYFPSKASEASVVLGGLIEAVALEGQPTGEWVRVDMILKRTSNNPVAYEVDYIRSTATVPR